jgi:hypothetical protein
MQQITDNFTQFFSSSVSKVSPLVLPFLGFWFVLNWQVVFILLLETDLSVEDRILWAEMLLDDSCNTFFFPLFYSLIAVLAAPFIETGLVLVKNWVALLEQNQKHKLRTKQANQEKQIAEQEYNTEYVKKHGVDVDTRKLILEMVNKSVPLATENAHALKGMQEVKEFARILEQEYALIDWGDLKDFHKQFKVEFDNLDFKQTFDKDLNEELLVKAFNENPELFITMTSVLLNLREASEQHYFMGNVTDCLTALSKEAEALETISTNSGALKGYLTPVEDKEK